MCAALQQPNKSEMKNPTRGKLEINQSGRYL